jgi:ubiquitin C-terminal hydrolase
LRSINKHLKLEQFDAAEFLIWFLEAVSHASDHSDAPFNLEQLNAASKEEEQDLQDGKYLAPPKDAYAEQWTVHRRFGHTDPVTEIFTTSVVMEHGCLGRLEPDNDLCNFLGRAIHFANYVDFEFPEEVPEAGFTLRQLASHYLVDHAAKDIECGLHPKAHNNHHSQFRRLLRLPNVLMLSIHRHKLDSHGRAIVRRDHVHVPAEEDFSYLVNSNLPSDDYRDSDGSLRGKASYNAPTQYVLISCINYLRGPHYVSYIRGGPTHEEGWIRYDDMSETPEEVADLEQRTKVSTFICMHYDTTNILRMNCLRSLYIDRKT